jgi:sugar lactone lactonase YvrE
MTLRNVLTNLRPNAVRSVINAALLACILAGASTRLRAQSDYATPYTFALLAGAGDTGSADGTGAAAHFDNPVGVALDSGGDLFVADKSNQVIREVTSGGVVTTIAGMAGSFGTTDGTGSAARFNQPTGVAVGSGGDIYVADSGNNTIRRVTAQGAVTTLAGTAGTGGLTDGTGGAGLFNQPYGIAIDGSGNLFVTDFGNALVRKVTQGGVVTTIAGLGATPGHVDGDGSTARFNQPTGIAIDGSGNLYVADSGNDTIRKVTQSGSVTTIAGTAGAVGSADGMGAAARFNGPRGIAVDGSGNLYVADAGNSAIRKITPAGAVTTLAGKPGNFANVEGTGSAAIFDAPAGIAVDSGGSLYVSEELADVISKGAAATVSGPVLSEQPQSQTIANGTTVVFNAGSSGLPAPTFQWYFNGTALTTGSGATGTTGPNLVISGATAANAGSYYFTATNSTGTVQSSPATLAVSATTDVGRLTNISCRSQVGTGANILIAGFAVGGAGTSGTEPLLIRASGPALATFDVAGILPDPELQLFANSSMIGSNTAWAGNSQVAATAASVGAFPWTVPSSHDSALLETLGAGPYSAQVSGESGDSGVALAEVYDTTPAGSYTLATPRLINISARTQVGTGANILIAGFVIGGTTSRTVLIRASGPALAAFSVTGLLPDPELQLFGGSTLLLSNSGWGGDPEIAAAAASVGAFAWTSPTSADSALLVTLPPGIYSAQVSGATGDTGVALVEVYEDP